MNPGPLTTAMQKAIKQLTEQGGGVAWITFRVLVICPLGVGWQIIWSRLTGTMNKQGQIILGESVAIEGKLHTDN